MHENISVYTSFEINEMRRIAAPLFFKKVISRSKKAFYYSESTLRVLPLKQIAVSRP